jgi:hypothetical protein
MDKKLPTASAPMKKEELDQKDQANANGNRFVSNFRHSPDIENFYRFVFENSLRREAKMIFEKVLEKISRPKKKKKSKISH